MSIWTDAILDQYQSDALQQIPTDVPCIFKRNYLATTIGFSVYTLPSDCVTLTRVQWRGRTVDPLGWEEFQLLTPATVVVDATDNTKNVETSSGKPQWYCLHPTNVKDLRFFPAPNESLSATIDATHDPYKPLPNEPRCAITYFANVDSTDPVYDLPDYIARRTVKAYVLWKCFEKEGPGQDLRASKFYQDKYNFLIARFKEINSGCFVSKRYQLQQELTVNNQRYPRPMLPPNFERVIY